MAEKSHKMATEFPPTDDGTKIVSVKEALVMSVMKHVGSLTDALRNGVNYIDAMLTNQLQAAIGKYVESEDFIEYMRFHDTKLYTEMFAPQLFCYAVRREGRFPEGLVSIEQVDDRMPSSTGILIVF